jgi:hypothetical protein
MTNVMGSDLGDIFWDLAPWIVYEPGYDLGCTICVANPGDTEKEYTLMARLFREGTLISEEALPVFGLSWFTVKPGDLVKLKGALRFDETDAELDLLLVERETEGIADSVVTTLVSPVSASALPPAWPGSGATAGIEDWSTLLALMLPVFMLGMVGAALAPKDEKKEKAITGQEAVKQLPLGRGE